MRASIDTFQHPGAPGMLRKQAIAPMGAVQPTTVAERLNCIPFERFDEILGAKVRMASILTAVRSNR